MTIKPSPEVLKFRQDKSEVAIALLNQLDELVNKAGVRKFLTFPYPNGEKDHLSEARIRIINGFLCKDE